MAHGAWADPGCAGVQLRSSAAGCVPARAQTRAQTQPPACLPAARPVLRPLFCSDSSKANANISINVGSGIYIVTLMA